MKFRVSFDLVVGMFLGVCLACVIAVGTFFHLTSEVHLGEAANHRLRVQVRALSAQLGECVTVRQEYSCPDSASNAFLTCVEGPIEDIYLEIRISSLEDGGVCEPD